MAKPVMTKTVGKFVIDSGFVILGDNDVMSPENFEKCFDIEFVYKNVERDEEGRIVSGDIVYSTIIPKADIAQR